MENITRKFTDELITRVTGDAEKVTFTVSVLSVEDIQDDAGNWVIDLHRDDVGAMSEHLYFSGVSTCEVRKHAVDRVNRHCFSDHLIEAGHGNDERIQLVMHPVKFAKCASHQPDTINIGFTVHDIRALASHFSAIDRMKTTSGAHR